MIEIPENPKSPFLNVINSFRKLNDAEFLVRYPISPDCNNVGSNGKELRVVILASGYHFADAKNECIASIVHLTLPFDRFPAKWANIPGGTWEAPQRVGTR
jgi:hypothetical protein